MDRTDQAGVRVIIGTWNSRQSSVVGRRLSVVSRQSSVVSQHLETKYLEPGTWNLELLEPGTIGTWNYWNLEPLEPGTIGTWNYWNLELLEPGTIGTWN
jgi:hypothetical protein